MKFATALIPLAAVTALTGYIAFHPGKAMAEPRIALTHATPMALKSSFTIDPMHAGIYFEITHLGLSKVTGRFNKFSGKIFEGDAKDLTTASVEFSAQVDSIDTGVAPRDAHLRTADFFEVAKYPSLTFKSTKVEKTPTGYLVTGNLTIKDKTKEISIPFKHYGPLKMTVGEDATRIGIVADPIVLKRSDFGVGAQFKLPDGTEGASDAVTIRISFEAILDKVAE